MAFRLREEKKIIVVEPMTKPHVLALFEKKLEMPGDARRAPLLCSWQYLGDFETAAARRRVF